MINIIKETICGQYEYNNSTANISGNYEKNGLNDTLSTLSGVCYSLDNTIYYGSFNGSYNKDINKMKYIIFETKPEYKEIIKEYANEIEVQI